MIISTPASSAAACMPACTVCIKVSDWKTTPAMRVLPSAGAAVGAAGAAVGAAGAAVGAAGAAGWAAQAVSSVAASSKARRDR